MSINVVFLDDPVPQGWSQPGVDCVLGQITIGDFHERMAVPLSHWTKEQYTAQWREAADNILTRGASKAVLVTQHYNPEKEEAGYMLECWPMYREGDKIYVRNFYQPYPKSGVRWHPETLDSLVTDRDPKEEASEWVISVKDLADFRSRI